MGSFVWLVGVLVAHGRLYTFNLDSWPSGMYASNIWGKVTFSGSMDEFLEEVGAYASQIGLSPVTVVGRAAKVSGGLWAKWSARTAFPTARTMDRIRAYIRANPAQPPASAALL